MRTQSLFQCSICKQLRWIIKDEAYPFTVEAIKLAWDIHLNECLNKKIREKLLEILERRDLLEKIVYGIGVQR